MTSNDDRRREERKAAAQFAIANAEIEGGKVTEKTRDLLSRWSAGDIDDDKLIEGTLGAIMKE